ncbi:DUF402 domain-containing protein [Mycobacterium sp.]|uniref:DUF402 domain-containing protein n=1 Tax=Mycobacterium sp. TaxID=1785 RepID=UPI003A8576E2
MRTVDEYRVRPWGLYLARPTPGRAQFHYLESWLLPSLGVRATVFHFNPGHVRDQDYYLDIGEYTPGDTVWRSEDHYLDIAVRTGRGAELIDIGELLDAVGQGLLAATAAERAIRRAVRAIDGLAANGYNLHGWLAGHGMRLDWRAAPPNRAGTSRAAGSDRSDAPAENR